MFTITAAKFIVMAYFLLYVFVDDKSSRLYACLAQVLFFTYPFCHMSSWCKEAQPATDGLQLTKFDLVRYNGCLVLMLKEYFTFCNFKCSDYTEWMLPGSIFVLELTFRTGTGAYIIVDWHNFGFIYTCPSFLYSYIYCQLSWKAFPLLALKRQFSLFIRIRM